jgi:hypothetical protein
MSASGSFSWNSLGEGIFAVWLFQFMWYPQPIADRTRNYSSNYVLNSVHYGTAEMLAMVS